MQGNPNFFYIKTKRLLDMFDNFRDEFDDFHKEHGSESDFLSYMSAKVSDLRKDVDWLRKITPKNYREEK